jgi:hypothetical protein
MVKGRKLTAKEQSQVLKDNPQARVRVFKQLLQHLRAGYSIECFGPLSEITIKKYLATYPEEFIGEDMVQAMRDGQLGWETIGRKQSDGSCMGNSRSWFYNMAHRYGWTDKIDVRATHEGNMQVNIVNYSSKTNKASKPDNV